MTAGNSSGLNDGAAALVIASEEKARELGVEPLGAFVASAVAGVDPRVMGIGPVPAVRKLLERAGVGVGDLDLVELNEAFASQSLAVVRELGLDEEKVNVNGGAIAIGHPLGMSGARLVVTLLHELRRRGGRYGVATMCVGVGRARRRSFERLDASRISPPMAVATDASTGSSSTARRSRAPPPATSSSPRPARRSAPRSWRASPRSTAPSRPRAPRSTATGARRPRTSAPASCTRSPTRSPRTARSSRSSSRATSARRSPRRRPSSSAPSRTSASTPPRSARSPAARTRSAARCSRTR